MPYLLLGLAIGAEVLGTSLLRATHGFSRLGPTAICLVAYAVSFMLLAHVVRDLPTGVVYAMWSGLGTVAIVGIGVTFAGQALTAATVVGVLLVVAGVVVLNLGTAAH